MTVSDSNVDTNPEIAQHIQEVITPAPPWSVHDQNLAQCALILGSNLDADRNLSAALEALASAEYCSLHRVSAPLQTPALDADGQPTNQPAYINLAVLVSTNADYSVLYSRLRELESKLGRQRTSEADSPVVIDIDIVLFVQPEANHWRYIFIDSDVENVPYVAIPLAWLIPDWVHPTVGKRMATIAQNFGTHFQSES